MPTTIAKQTASATTFGNNLKIGGIIGALPGWLSLVVVLVWLGALVALALLRLRRLDVTE